MFFRDDITPEQAREMLLRYKEIEKIKDKKEYAKALFSEAKKNFGLENSPIKLVFKEKNGLNGYCSRDNSEIAITSNATRYGLMSTIHHELRHAIQHKMAYNMFPKRAENVIYGKNKLYFSFFNNVLGVDVLKEHLES